MDKLILEKFPSSKLLVTSIMTILPVIFHTFSSDSDVHSCYVIKYKLSGGWSYYPSASGIISCYLGSTLYKRYVSK